MRNIIVITIITFITVILTPAAFAQTVTITPTFSPAAITAPANTDFTLDVLVNPSADITAQVYTIIVNFDTQKLEVKGINYLKGSRSANLGGDGDHNLAEINSRASPAEIKAIGEILDPAGLPVTRNQNTAFVKLTFRAKTAQSSNINVLTQSKIIIVKPDGLLDEISFSTAALPINSTTGTTSFKIAESQTGPAGCSAALGASTVVWQAYTAHPMPYTHTLSTPLSSNDVRTICAQFQKSDGTPSQIFTKIIKYTPDPTITRLDCTHSPTGVGTNITIKGVNLGAQGNSGKVKVKGEEVDVTAWDEGGGTITLSVGQRLEGRVAVAVTTNDNKTITKNCTINLTTVEFETTTQCKLPGQFSASNVDVKVFERQVAGLTTPEPIQRQKISIDASGKPQGFVPRFEKGKNYTLLIKFTGALAKKVEFKAEGGTAILDPISFPVGDIAPATSPDGKINAFDKSELIRQWSLARDVSKTGDFNGDSRINSLDYSCMVKNFNASDETYTPLTATPSPSPQLTISPSPTQQPISAPIVPPSPSPSPAGGVIGTAFRVSFDPNFSTVAAQGNLDPITRQLILDLELPAGSGQKTVYIQLGSDAPITATVILTGT